MNTLAIFPLNRTGARVPFFFLFPLYMSAERRPERGSCLPRGSCAARSGASVNEGLLIAIYNSMRPCDVNHKIGTRSTQRALGIHGAVGFFFFLERAGWDVDGSRVGRSYGREAFSCG